MKKFIITNYQNGLNTDAITGRTKYPSKLNYYNDAYIQRDFCTISSVKVNDLFRAVGSIKITKVSTGASLSFTGSQSINSHYFDTTFFCEDLTAAFQSFGVVFSYNSVDKNFVIVLEELTSAYTLSCAGNM